VRSEPPLCSAAEIAPEWLAMVRATLEREGVALRAGAGPSIEVQSMRDGIFRPLQLPNNGRAFRSVEDRDQIFRQLQPKYHESTP
jgi:hypothetical protein